MITIQPFTYTDADYQTVVTIDAAVFGGHPVPVEEWKHDDQTRNPDYPFQRHLICCDGEIVAFAEAGQNQFAYHPQKYFCRIFVDPAHDAADIRPAYLDHLLEALRGKDVIAITSGMLDDKSEAMRFFAEYGFQEVAREQLSMLDVSAFDPAPLNSLVEQVRASGIEIAVLRDLQTRDPNWQRKLFEMETLISRDIPTVDTKRAHTLESWSESRLKGPKFDPDGWFVALDGDSYVGESQGSINQAETAQFQTGVTGVLREYRRRGIATALKVHLILYAQQHGVQQIQTSNDSKNPMYQLNLSLGFKPQPAWVRVEKTL
jgi:GNAT superfamily N-acetyltransferase